MISRWCLLFGFVFLGLPVLAQSLLVGFARTNITPSPPIWMTGYANRNEPAKGLVHDLWAKAMYLENAEKEKALIITMDLLGLSREVFQGILQGLKAEGLAPEQIIINSSHTHSGPMIWPALSGIAQYEPKDQSAVSAYTLGLIPQLVDLGKRAMANKQAMQLSLGHGEANFAINRRQATGKSLGQDWPSPVDHEVPVLVAKNTQGQIQGILMGYACHNTTVQGDNYLVNGDYAGFAQLALEKKYPQATAMFLLGCAGDQNPAPRGNLALAEQHGQALAAAVTKVLQSPMKSLGGQLRSASTQVGLEFKPMSLENMRADLLGSEVFKQRRAKLLLEAYNKGWEVQHYRYPIHGLRIGQSFTLLALAGEVVVDYSLNIKKAYPKEEVFVAGYSQEVMLYIPNQRILKEGGYEAESSMIYYGWPGPFQENVEDRIMQGVHQVMRSLGLKQP